MLFLPQPVPISCHIQSRLANRFTRFLEPRRRETPGRLHANAESARQLAGAGAARARYDVRSRLAAPLSSQPWLLGVYRDGPRSRFQEVGHLASWGFEPCAMAISPGDST